MPQGAWLLLQCVYLSLSPSVSPFLFSNKIGAYSSFRRDWWKVICSASVDPIVPDYGNHLYNFNAFPRLAILVWNISKYYVWEREEAIWRGKECDSDWQTDRRGCDRDVINLDLTRKILPFFNKFKYLYEHHSDVNLIKPDKKLELPKNNFIVRLTMYWLNKFLNVIWTQ